MRRYRTGHHDAICDAEHDRNRHDHITLRPLPQYDQRRIRRRGLGKNADQPRQVLHRTQARDGPDDEPGRSVQAFDRQRLGDFAVGGQTNTIGDALDPAQRLLPDVVGDGLQALRRDDDMVNGRQHQPTKPDPRRFLP